MELKKWEIELKFIQKRISIWQNTSKCSNKWLHKNPGTYPITKWYESKYSTIYGFRLKGQNSLQ